MSDAQSTFALNLEDGTSGPAGKAAHALEALKKQIGADTKELAALQRAMKNLQGGTSVNIQQFRALQKQIDEKKQAISQATSAVIALGGSLTSTGGKGGKITSLLEQLEKNAQGVGGPLGTVSSRLGAVRSMLGGGLIALGIVAITAALVGLTAASIAAGAALLKYGIGQANARRAELLRLEGLTKLRDWYGIAAGNANELQSAIDNVAGKSALGRDQIAKYAEQLYRAHLRGTNLSTALEAVAIKASTQGEAQAQMFASWAAGAALARGSVKRLADDVKARLGGIASRQLLDLDVQTQKMRENFDALFRGLKIEGLLKALTLCTDLLSQSTATGRALKSIVEGLFQPMINQIEYLAPIAKRFFQGMVIAALLMTIAILKVRNWFKKTFGDSEILKGFDATKLALNAGVFAAIMLVGALGAVLVIAGLIAAPFVIAGAAIWGLLEAVHAVYSLIAGINWGSLGGSIIDGLVGGLKSGAKWVIETVKGLATSVTKTFKETLGIASPSKVFARLGVAIPQGVQVGVQRGTPALERAVEQTVDVPSSPRFESNAPPASEAVQGSAAGGRGNVSMQGPLWQGDMHVHGANAQEQAEDFRRQLEGILETVALQLGARMAGGPA